MDYSKIFEEKYQATFQNLENFVNSEFKSSKEDDEDERDYQETYNEVRSKLEEWRSQHFENSSLKPNVEIYNYFTSRNNKVTFPEHLFPGVLERKTKKLFLEKHSEADYPAFIDDLAENKAYQDIIDIVNNYDKYFDLVYKDKKWKPIDLTNFDHNYESAEYFLKLHKKIYPPTNIHRQQNKKDYTRGNCQTKQRLNLLKRKKKFFCSRCFTKDYTKRTWIKQSLLSFAMLFPALKIYPFSIKKLRVLNPTICFRKNIDYFIKLEKGKFLNSYK